MNEFTALVNQELCNRKMSVTRLARLAGISVPYMHELLREDSNKRWNEDTMKQVSEVLGIKVKFEVC